VSRKGLIDSAAAAAHDSDLVSKRAFFQLMQLFTMTDTGPKQNLPVVTIPSR
jgi:hypothetical protein